MVTAWCAAGDGAKLAHSKVEHKRASDNMLGSAEEAAAKGSTKGNAVEGDTMKGMLAISKTKCKTVKHIHQVVVSG